VLAHLPARGFEPL